MSDHEHELETNFETETLSETENFIVWKATDEDEVLYHIELGGITLHLTGEEWDELVTLIKGVD